MRKRGKAENGNGNEHGRAESGNAELKSHRGLYYKGFKLVKSVTNCRIDTACTGLYTEENNKDYLTEKYEGRQ